MGREHQVTLLTSSPTRSSDMDVPRPARYSSVVIASIPGFFPTIGLVLLGSFLSLAAALTVEEYRLKTQRRSNAYLASTELRVAARLVSDEINGNLARIEGALMSDRWWPSDQTLMSEEWTSYRDVLARGLPHEAWVEVSITYRNTQSLNNYRSQLPGDARPSAGQQRSDPDDVVWQAWSELDNANEQLHNGYRVLAAYA